MKLNFSKFKKVAEDKKATTLRHEDGHEIMIDHRALSPGNRRELQSLPIYAADGADVQEIDQSAAPEQDSDTSPAFPVEQMPAAAPVNNDADAALYGAPVPAAPPVPNGNPTGGAAGTPAPVAPGALAPQANDDPYGMNAYGQTALQGAGQEMLGNQMQANAAGMQGKQQAMAAKQYADSLQKIQTGYQQAHDQVLGEINGVTKDFQNQTIDYNHFMENQSTPAKVRTAIGLFLGSIGSALTHGPNAAEEWLKEQMNRDVESQKASLGKKNTLLSYYYKQLGNLDDATKMTQASTAALYGAMLNQAAGNSGSAAAQAVAMQKNGELMRSTVAPLAQQVAASQTMNKASQSGSGIDPASIVRIKSQMGMIPKDAQLPISKELGEAQNHAVQRDAVLGAFDEANDQNTLLGRASHAGFQPGSVAKLQTALLPYLKDAEGRINEQELQRTDALTPAPGDSAQKIRDKHQGMVQFLKEKDSRPLMQMYGIPKPVGIYDENGMKPKLGAPVPNGR